MESLVLLQNSYTFKSNYVAFFILCRLGFSWHVSRNASNGSEDGILGHCSVNRIKQNRYTGTLLVQHHLNDQYITVKLIAV